MGLSLDLAGKSWVGPGDGILKGNAASQVL